MNLKWWHFSQNNSGGKFIVDDEVAHDVFIQAPHVDYALFKAHKVLGSSGYDWCPCCGERWSFWIDEDEGSVAPEAYGENVFTCDGGYFREEARLHYFDGRVEVVKYKENP